MTEHTHVPMTLHGRQTPHDFDEGNPSAERGTRWVLAITLAMMAVEIVAGWRFGSMALLADGWHMSSHAVAIGTAALAYAMARRHVNDQRYAWGTWKIEVLGAFASAMVLLAVALIMAWESVTRLLQPVPVEYGEAILVAVIGLVVNLVCARILHGASHHHDEHDHHDHGEQAHAEAHDDEHEHEHEHEHDHDHHHDINLRSAYVHVLADAMTSLLAIGALVGGLWFGWQWLDPVIGLVGSVVVFVWAIGLLRNSAATLLDREMEGPIVDRLRRRLIEADEQGDVEVSDLHVWRVGRARYACIISLVTHRADLSPEQVRGWLKAQPELYHVTIEISHCAACGSERS